MQDHDKIPRSERPQRGETYIMKMGDKPLLETEILSSGSCWAKVRVVKRLEAPDDPLYTPGAEFEVRQTQYEFEPVEN